MTIRMASLLAGIIMSLSFSAQAHDLKEMSKATNPLVQEFLAHATTWVGDREKIFIEPMHVFKVFPVKDNETSESTLIRVMKYHLHLKYSITGDDGGYHFIPMNGQPERALRSKMDDWFNDESESVTQQQNLVIQDLLKISKETDLVVLYGSGSGNNTHAGIIAVLDLKNQEFVYVIVSNFGSDD